jgi:hypothetical protein
MCEQMGNEPIPEEIPIDYGDLDFNCQMALKIFNMLPDNIEGMSGSWLGKDFSGLGTLLEVYEVDERAKVLDLIMILISETDKHYKQQQKQKAQKSKSRR